ncbi:MAG: hypothetical protein WCA46_25955, partial [Actinocatenispora sp.]
AHAAATNGPERAAGTDSGPAGRHPGRVAWTDRHRTLAAVARYKATHDTAPRVAISTAARQDMGLRTEQALRYYAMKRDVARGAGIAPAATSRILSGTQQPQLTAYWCGPAAVAGALAARHVGVSQSGAADLLRTTVYGTAWSGVDAAVPGSFQTGYPVADVLTYKLHDQGATYHPAWLSYSPTRAEMRTYRARLVTDIDGGWDLVGNAWEVPGGPHLVGHPGNQEVFHFFTVRGYTDSGANTQYQDSVHGAGSVSWASGVPAYSTISSDTLTVINGGRGYVW